MIDIKSDEVLLKNGKHAGKGFTIAILGAGTVGGGLIRLIQENLAHISLPLEIRRVGVRNLSKSRSPFIPEEMLSDDLESIVEDPEVDILVEAIGGLEPARTYIEKALRAGKHVVTANKYVVSECGDRLQQLAAANGKHFLYEASVAGSIPIIEILKEGVIPDKINAIYAILNGTTNFILTRMTEASEDFRSALAKAQELGFSEPDPGLDVSGKDAAQKLSILISILKHQHCHPAQIDVRGIEFLTPGDFQFAAERHCIIKPLSIYEEHGTEGFASVEPVLVPNNSVFASARNEYNALCLDCKNVGKQILIGKGAGELPTASALLSDLRKITQAQDSKPFNQWSRFADDVATHFRPSIENPREYPFYVSCSPRREEKRRKIVECLSIYAESVHQTTADECSGIRLAVATKAITHAELHKALDMALSFDPDAQISWLKILRDF